MLGVRPDGGGRGRGRRRAGCPVRPRRRRRPARASASTWTSPFAGPARPGGTRRARCAHTLGAWLLDEAGYRGHPAGRGSRRPRRRLVRDLPGPVGVLAMGDGSARRTVKAPGTSTRRPAPFDAAVAAALAAGDADALAALDPAEGERLLAAGVPTWRAVGAALTGRHDRRPGCTSTTRRSASATSSPTGWPRERAPPVVAVVGPTATGKTALAVALARRLGGEVVNADSMQLYRGMDIGTAKPDVAERGGVPHHLLDLWHVREPASVAEYRLRARAEIDRLRAAGVVPLLVGGSGLYVRAVLDELDFPGTDPAVRARLEAELAAVGPARAARPAGRARPGGRGGGPAQQRTADRARAGGHRADRRPVPRPAARAARRTTRRSSSAWTGTRPSSTSGSPCGWTRMWAAGFVAEVEALAADGLREGPDGVPRAGLRAGARAVRRRADRRTRPASATVTTTRRFVRRQRSWFRRDAAAHLVRRRPARPGRRGRRARSPPVRSARDVAAGSAGAHRARHRERLRRPARPRRHRLAGVPAGRGDWSAGCATAGPASAATACCASSAAVHVPDAAAVLGDDLDALRVVHGPPQRRRLARRDVRQRHPAVPARAGHRGAARPGDLRGRRPGRHPRRPAPGRRAPRTASYWVDMGPARPFGGGEARVSGQGVPGPRGVDGQPAPGLPHRRRPRHPRPHGRRRRSTPALFPEGVNVELVNVAASAGRAHPAAGVRARGGRDPLLRHRRLRRRLRRAGRRRPDRRAPSSSTSPAAACRCEVDARDDGAHRPGRPRRRPACSAAEWLGA